MSFIDVANAVAHIGKVNGRNDKVALVKEYGKLVGFKEIMQFIFNPYIKTGIGAAKLKKAVSYSLPTIVWQDFISHFTTHQTGSDADVGLAQAFIKQQTSQEACDLATAMATKTLKIGVTETTLNQVFGDAFIPKIGIMRGEKYFDVKDKVKGPFIVTEKLDGARRLLVKEAGHVKMYTRSGHEDEGLVEIEQEAQYLPDNTVFDGELLAVGEFEDSVALRQATNALANSKGVRRGLTYNVFDMIALEDFKRGVSSHKANARKALVAAMFRDPSLQVLLPDNWQENHNIFGLPYDFTHIKPVPILGLANTEREILDFAEPIWARRFEGVMLNTLDGLYEINPNPRRQLLKVKATEEFTLKVVGVFEGEGNFAGMLGGVYLDYKGYQVGCGSGFNKQQRQRFWNNPELIVGKMVEGDSFGESKNKQGGVSLNCPIFKRIVGDAE